MSRSACRSLAAAAALVVSGACAATPRAEPDAAPAAATKPAQPVRAAVERATFRFENVADKVAYVRRFLVLGPFDSSPKDALDTPFVDESAASPRAEDVAGGHVWVEHRSLTNHLDFRRAVESEDHRLAYAFTYLHVDRDVDLVLWIQHDDGARVWVDGSLLYESRLRAPGTVGVPVRLPAGVHRLLAKVDNETGDHALRLRLAAADGGPAPNVIPSTSPDGPEPARAALAEPAMFHLAELLALLPTDAARRIDFTDRGDLTRLAFGNMYEDNPKWFDTGAAPSGPNPGGKGSMSLHPVSPDLPGFAYWKVKTLAGPCDLHVRVSSDPFVAPGKADALLRLSIFDGELRPLAWTVVGPDPGPSPNNWRDIRTRIPSAPDTDVLVVLEVANGGTVNWLFEGIYFDFVEVVAAKK